MGHAIKKYGFDSFELSVLRSFGNHGLTQILLDTFERKYILEYNTTDRAHGYNKNTGGGSASLVNDEIKEKISKSNTGKIRSEETKSKYSEATLKYFALHGSPCTGVPKKEETKKKISDKLRGVPWSQDRRDAFHISEETREKMRSSHRGVPWSDTRRDRYIKKYIDNPNYERRSSSLKGRPWSKRRREMFEAKKKGISDV
jgi:hypothetical protein